jgi:hypothetical protein
LKKHEKTAVKSGPRRPRLLDVLIVAVTLAVGACGYVLYDHAGEAGGGADSPGSGSESGQYAEADIYIGKELIETVGLGTDRDIEVRRDGSYNLVRVSGGGISVAEADCPDKTCVHMGAKNRSGDMIVCLPNRLQIMVKGGMTEGDDEDESTVDAVSG